MITESSKAKQYSIAELYKLFKEDKDSRDLYISIFYKKNKIMNQSSK